MSKYSPVVVPVAPWQGQRRPKQLAAYFKWFTGVIPERLSMLSVLATEGGLPQSNLDFSPESLGSIGAWFVSRVETRQLTSAEKRARQNSLGPRMRGIALPGYDLADATLSLVFDVGVYLGEVLRRSRDGVRWAQSLDSPRDADYGHAVLAGLGPINCNPVRLAQTCAYVAADGNRNPKCLCEAYEYWSKVGG